MVILSFDIDSHVIFETIWGSHAQGLNTENSDVDYRGVCVLPKNIAYGFCDSFEQQDKWEDKSLDRVIFGIQKFFLLASQSNPNVLEMLYTDQRFHKKSTHLGDVLLENRSAFLSKRAFHSFYGYAISQLNRIKRHRRWLLDPPETQPARKDFGLPENKALIDATTEGAFNKIFAELLEASGYEHESEQFKLEYCNPKSPDYRDPISMVQAASKHRPEIFETYSDVVSECLNIKKDLIAIITREKEYKSATAEWQQYQNWKKNRNPERAKLEAKHGYDCKHAMHLVRLIKLGREVLEKKTLTIYRTDDKDELLSIRQGKWKFEEIVAYAVQQKTELKQLIAKSSLPEKPDMDYLNDLCVSIQDEFLIKQSKK